MFCTQLVFSNTSDWNYGELPGTDYQAWVPGCWIFHRHTHKDPTNFTEMVFTGMQKSFPYLPYNPLAVFHYRVWKVKHSISQFPQSLEMAMWSGFGYWDGWEGWDGRGILEKLAVLIRDRQIWSCLFLLTFDVNDHTMPRTTSILWPWHNTHQAKKPTFLDGKWWIQVTPGSLVSFWECRPIWSIHIRTS